MLLDFGGETVAPDVFFFSSGGYFGFFFSQVLSDITSKSKSTPLLLPSQESIMFEYADSEGGR